MPPTNPRRQLLAKVAVDEQTGCWVWTGSRQGYKNWYGRMMIKGRIKMTHRVSYELFVGPIPEGLTIDHLCKNTLCVNPAHLEPVTAGENALRGDGPCARNARKTHCLRGHPLAGSNLTVRPDGVRVCRTCRRANDANQRRRKAAAQMLGEGSTT